MVIRFIKRHPQYTLTLALLLGVVVIQTLLLLPLNTLPLVDLPNHLAEATILQAQGKTNSLLSSHYTASRLSWHQPAIAHMVICSWFPSVMTGNIILYLLYVIALPSSVVACARLCRGSPLIALLSVLLIWNANALWGFAEFTLALPVFLRRSTSLAVVGLVAGYMLLTAHYFIAFRPLDRQFTRFFQSALAGHQKPVAFIIDDPYYKTLPVFIHYNNYQIIWNQGPTPTCITRYRFGVIRPTETPLPGYCEWTSRFGQKRLFETIERYRNLETLVTQGHRPRTLLRRRADYTLEKKTGSWALFSQSRHQPSH